MENEENILGKEKIGKLIRKFSIPCIISLLVNSLYNIVDQIFIGWGVGYLGNGATNVVFPLTMICLAFSLMFGDGASAYLSLKLGEKKKEEAEVKIAEAENLLSEVKAKAEDKVSNKNVLTVSPKNDGYTAHTSSSFVGQVLEKAGFTNAVQSEDVEASLSLEQLVEIDPDIIVYMREDIDTTIYEEWKDTELYKSLKSVKNNEVYVTVSRKPWTQYRGFISVKTLMKEMSGWLLEE